MENRFAHFLSYAFHPLFVPLFMVVLLFNSHTYVAFMLQDEIKLWVYITMAVNMVIIPCVIFAYMKRKGMINSFQMESKEERRLPMVITLISYVGTNIMLQGLGLDALVHLMILGAAFTVVISFFITLKWKISVHMIGMGGVVGTIIGLMLQYHALLIDWLYILIFLSGLVAYARLKLSAHTPAQVYAGFTLGVVWMSSLILLA